MEEHILKLLSLSLFLTGLAQVQAQTPSERVETVRAYRLASLWQDNPNVSEAMVSKAAGVCLPVLNTSLEACDATLSSAPDVPGTLEADPYCRSLSEEEFIDCVKVELETQ